MPVAGVTVPGRELLVAFDALEPTRALRASHVGVPPGVEGHVSERTNLDRGLLLEFDHQCVCPTGH